MCFDYRRVAALKAREEKSGHSQTPGKAAPPGGQINPQYRGLSVAEREIAERLDKLKEKTPEEGLCHIICKIHEKN